MCHTYVNPEVELQEDFKKATKGLCVHIAFRSSCCSSLAPLRAPKEEKRKKNHTQFSNEK